MSAATIKSGQHTAFEAYHPPQNFDYRSKRPAPQDKKRFAPPTPQQDDTSKQSTQVNTVSETVPAIRNRIAE